MLTGYCGMRRRPNRIQKRMLKNAYRSEEMLWLLYCWAATLDRSFRLDYGRR
jgi:hypothetical protein